MAAETANDVMVLEPHLDKTTGTIIYMEAAEVATQEAGPPLCSVFVSPGTDYVVRDGGTIVSVPADASQQADVVSRLPEGRMAASSWDEIAQTLRKVENGTARGSDVELRPGGTLVLTGRDGKAEPVSRLPQGRMAAANPGPTAADVETLRRLDPANVEEWAPVTSDLVAGWTFRLRPPFAGQATFVFFAFRSPSDGNAYRIAVLEPDMDNEFGHVPHMINAYVGGQRIPVICGPVGAPAANLAEVRTHAAKWMAYTSARIAGRSPGFSL